MADKPKLLPCPFCGSGHLKISSNVYDGLLRVQCENCWATSMCSNQRGIVIEAWNKRAEIIECQNCDTPVAMGDCCPECDYPTDH